VIGDLLHSVVVFVLYHWPPWAVVVCSMVLGGVIGFLLHFGFDPMSKWLKTNEHAEIAGHFLGVLGVIYAVVLGLVVITAWQQFDHTEEVSMHEQNDFVNLFDAFMIDEMKPEQQRAPLLLMRDYAFRMTGEWEQMRRGEPLCLYTNYHNERDPWCQPNLGKLPASRWTNDLLLVIRTRTIERVSTAAPGRAVDDQKITFLHDLIDTREHRRHHYLEPPVQGVLWVAFFLGALMIAGVTYLSEEQSRVQRVRIVALCALIGMMFSLVLIFDHPFIGKYAVSGRQWCNIVDQINLELNHGAVQPSVERATACPL
jgi:hypothetical protein